MRGKITKRAVDTLEDGVLWDPELRGFGVRARAGGKVYVLKFRSGGKQRWHTIGRHGSPWTPETARKQARRILGELAAGKAPANKSQATVAEAVEAFIEAHCRHLRSGAQPAWLLRKYVVSRVGSRRPGSIGHGDVVQLLREVQGNDRTKRIRIANRVRVTLNRFFRWAIAEALIPSQENPVAGTEPRRGETKRERVLTDAEIATVWQTAGGWPFGIIVRLLLATGQRCGEVGGMRWSELDLEGRTWRIPAERSKGGRELNHSTAGLFGVTAIYLRDRQEEAKRAAMSVWDRRLRDILGMSPETPT